MRPVRPHDFEKNFHWKKMDNLKLYVYRISANSFREIYSRGLFFFDSEIVTNSNSCRNISIFYLLNCSFAAETNQGRKLLIN